MKTGSVTISQTVIEAAGQSFASGVVVAGFFDLPPGIPGCAISTVDGCTVSDCSAAADAGTPPDGGRVSAGSITVGGLVDGGITLTEGATGYQATISHQVFVPGATLTV
jgi:hypothetical protein